MGSERKDAPRPRRSVVLRRRAIEALGTVAFLGVVVSITLWLEADVFHERSNNEGLAILVALAIAVAIVGVIGVARGFRMTVDRIRKRRNA
jgi:O-antigen/teichoic acid export membrane protein